MLYHTALAEFEEQDPKDFIEACPPGSKSLKSILGADSNWVWQNEFVKILFLIFSLLFVTRVASFNHAKPSHVTSLTHVLHGRFDVVVVVGIDDDIAIRLWPHVGNF